MVAVVLVSNGIATDDLESLLKDAGWAAQSSPTEAQEWGLEARLKEILGAPGDRNPRRRTALIATVDVLAAHRAVEEILGQCSRVRVILVAPDSLGREERRAVLRALRSGADDFVAASAVRNEIALRLNAGRARHRQMPRLQRICGLQLERGARRLRHGVKVVSLTPCEYRVFACLASRPGNAISRNAIQRDLARRSRSVSKNMVDVYVLYLRRKLATLECSCSIRTVRGVGYTLTDEPIAVTPAYGTLVGSRVAGQREG